jgi:hypothetical protein
LKSIVPTQELNFSARALACLGFPSGLVAASTIYGKTRLLSGFDGTPEFAVFQRGHDYPANKAKSNANRQKKT